MGIQFNSLGRMPFLNVDSINRSLQRGKETDEQNGLRSKGQRDQSSFSNNSRIANIIENLTKQKQSVTDAKNELLANSIKDGLSSEDIKVQLEVYDEQLKNIETALENTRKMQFENMEGMDKDKDKKIKPIDDNTKTEKEVEGEKLNAISKATSDVKMAEKVENIKKGNENQVRTLESQVKLDKYMDRLAIERGKEFDKDLGKHGKFVYDPHKIPSTLTTDLKLEDVSEILGEAIDLNVTLSEKFSEINKNINEETIVEEQANTRPSEALDTTIKSLGKINE